MTITVPTWLIEWGFAPLGLAICAVAVFWLNRWLDQLKRKRQAKPAAAAVDPTLAHTAELRRRDDQLFNQLVELIRAGTRAQDRIANSTEDLTLEIQSLKRAIDKLAGQLALVRNDLNRVLMKVIGARPDL